MIYYNGQSLPFPLPLVERSEGVVFAGERFAIREQYRLNGQLIGCDGLNGLLTSGAALLNIFNKDFQELVISGDSEIIRKSGVIIEGIDFGQSNYAGAVPYTVTLSCYPSALQQVFGVLEPVDQWAFDEQQDGIVKITHNVSARAYGNFQNAVNFVQQRTGFSNYPAPQFLSLTGDFVLDQRGETVDRFNGLYGVNENYSIDTRSSGLLTRYTFSLNSGLEGFIQASLEGVVDGGILGDLNAVRGRYALLNPVSKAQSLYTQATDLADLNLTPLTSGVVEDVFAQRIQFNLTFDNNPDSIVSLDRTVSINSGDEITSVTVNGRIYGRGEHNSRWSQVQNYFRTVNVYGLAQSGYNYYGGNFVLNPKPLSSGTVFNQFSSEISFSAEFNDRVQPPAGFLNFDVQVGFQPAIRKIASKFLAANENPDESFYIVDLGYYPKPRMTLQGNATLDENVPIEAGKLLLIKEIQRLFYLYSADNAILEQKEITSNPDLGRQLTFNFAWIMDSDHRVNSEPRFDIVADLQV